MTLTDVESRNNIPTKLNYLDKIFELDIARKKNITSHILIKFGLRSFE